MSLLRNTFLRKLSSTQQWDILVIGGGATGLGIAVDAASRGYSTLLLEQSDFAKGTSSRSTKLIHGGVRYLAQGNIKLVYDALHERGILLKNAPHLVKKQSFIIPCYNFIEKMKFLIGLKLYDTLAGELSIGKSISLSKEQVIKQLPNVKREGLIGGVQYYDAQFDDARLAISLAQTSAEHGGVLLNYFKVNSLIKNDDRVCGVTATDMLNDKSYSINAKVVINATGIFVDEILQLDESNQKQLVRPSQGVHLVLDKSFLNSDQAILIPKTLDKRVLFAVPWHEHVLLGTTDTPLNKISLEPVALEQEINFILDTAKQYLTKPPQRKDVLSVFAGLRPLAAAKKSNSTKELSRDHKLIVSDSGLITITGGKWTTYRRMAEEVVNKAMEVGELQNVKCKTREIRIHGYEENSSGKILKFGSDEKKINQLIKQKPSLAVPLSNNFRYTEAHVVWCVRNEMAMTVEDILARRLRILFLDARVAIAIAPRVAMIMARELHYDEEWERKQVEEFNELAKNYCKAD